MTEDPFSGLATLLRSNGGTVERSKDTAAGLLLTWTEKLNEIREYLDGADQPTSANNLELLRQFLEVINRYLASFAEKTLRDTIEPTVNTVKLVRRHTQTLKLLVNAWEDRPESRPLREMSSDYDALLEKQDELTASLVTLVGHLGLAQDAMKEDAQSQHSPPSVHQGQGSPPDQIGEERSHHVQWRRKIG